MDNQPIVTRNVQRAVIVHTNGTMTFLGGTDEHSTLDELGGVTSVTTTLTIATIDGHILAQGDIAFQCTHCQTGPWSRSAMTTCTLCRRLVCVHCAQQHPIGTLCLPCYQAARRAARRAWLWSIF
jgi:hypothetical protein